MPPLRDRREDIIPIALKFARERLGRAPTIGRPMAAALLIAPWPDNVRGLCGILDNALVDSKDGLVTLTARVKARLDEMRALRPDAGGGEQAEFRKKRPDAAYLSRRLIELEGNVKALAQELGVARNTVYRWFKDAGVDPKKLR